MEALFGTTLIKYVPISQEAEAAHAEQVEKVKQAKELGEEGAEDLEEPATLSCYEEVSTQQLIQSITPYVILFFTAEYCPPCQGLLQPFQDFVREANKDKDAPKFQVVVINCDKNEDQYKEHLEKLPSDWYAIPFEGSGSEEAAAKLEDLASAVNIPKVSVLYPSHNLEELAIKDIKRIILKNSSQEASVKEVMEKIDVFKSQK